MRSARRPGACTAEHDGAAREQAPRRRVPSLAKHNRRVMLPRAGGLRSTVHAASRIALSVELATRAPARRARRPRPAALASWRHRGPPAPADNSSARVGPSHAGLITSQPRRSAPRCYARHVNALKAHVKNGQIVLDEPSELPEGMAALVQLYDPSGDSLGDEERVALHRALDRSIAQADAGELIDADEVLAELESEQLAQGS